MVMRFKVRCLLAIAAASVIALAGCETIGQDLKGLTKMISPTKPAEAAIMMMNPHDADDRREGTTLISNAPWGGADVYLAAYRDKVLNETDPIAKAASIRALARWSDPEDALRIMPHLSDANVQVRWEAAKGLQRMHNAAVVPELLKVLRDEAEQAQVRVATAIALGQYPEDRVFQGLVAALDARELSLNAAAERSLHTLTGQSFEMDSHRWLAWYDPAVAQGNAFAGQKQFMYPTYSRDDLWWERIMFWTHRYWEQPAPPAGLRPKEQRETYPEGGPALPRVDGAGE